MCKLKSELTKTKCILLSVVCLLVIIMEIHGIVFSAIEDGLEMFAFYTQESNMFMLIVCLIMFGFCLRFLIKGKNIPRFAYILYYMFSCCLTTLFLAVILIGVWFRGIRGLLFITQGLFMHNLCPILVTVSTLFMIGNGNFNVKHALFPTLYTVIYALISVILVKNGVINAPYPVFEINTNPWYLSFIYFVLCAGGCFLISLVIAICNKKINCK